MSIILDALKKAETERHLGALPGLHTPAPSSTGLQATATRTRIRVISSGILGAALLIALTAGWWYVRTVVPAAVSVASPAEPMPAAIAATAPPRMAGAVPAREIPVPPPLPVPITVFVAQPVAPAASETPSAVAGPVRRTRPLPDAASPEKIAMMAELSPALQRELPPLAVGGSMYSDNPAERMLLIDKRLLHEGEEVAPDLVLEKLMPKEAILRFHGKRFRIAF